MAALQIIVLVTAVMTAQRVQVATANVHLVIVQRVIVTAVHQTTASVTVLRVQVATVLQVDIQATTQDSNHVAKMATQIVVLVLATQKVIVALLVAMKAAVMATQTVVQALAAQKAIVVATSSAALNVLMATAQLVVHVTLLNLKTKDSEY